MMEIAFSLVSATLFYVGFREAAKCSCKKYENTERHQVPKHRSGASNWGIASILVVAFLIAVAVGILGPHPDANIDFATRTIAQFLAFFWAGFACTKWRVLKLASQQV